MINKDIYINMISESYPPLKEKENYLRKCYRINNKSNLLFDTEKMKIKNFDKIYNLRYYKNENQKINRNNVNQSYVNDINKIINFLKSFGIMNGLSPNHKIMINLYLERKNIFLY